MSQPARQPTLHDVARLAGVSVSTTSRALSGYGRISEVTREAIRAAAAELGYHRNSLARSMITGYTETIGVICADMGSPFFAEALRAVSDYARRQGFSTLIVNTDENLDAEMGALALLREKHVDGLIVAPADVQRVDHLVAFQREGRPVVLLDRTSSALAADSVTVDDVAATQHCVEHLIRAGHQRIGIVTELRSAREAAWTTMLADLHGVDRASLNPSSRRLLGYLHAHRNADLPIDPEMVARTGDTSSASAKAAAIRLLDRPDRPTALLSVDNSTSVGAYGAVRQLGLSVPDELSFVAFDNLDWTELVTPALTVIEQPVYDLGTRAAELVIGRIQGGEGPPSEHLLETRFIERGSTAAPPTR
jgi:LacI family transcriptional regulator